jgi:hypothetical protein
LRKIPVSLENPKPVLRNLPGLVLVLGAVAAMVGVEALVLSGREIPDFVQRPFSALDPILTHRRLFWFTLAVTASAWLMLAWTAVRRGPRHVAGPWGAVRDQLILGGEQIVLLTAICIAWPLLAIGTPELTLVLLIGPVADLLRRFVPPLARAAQAAQARLEQAKA